VSTTLSLDGFVAGPNHEMDWVFDNQFLPDEPVAAAEELIEQTGAILTGRHSYDVGRAASRAETSSAFGGRWSGPEFVLTHHAPTDEQDDDIRFLSGSIKEAVATALEAAHGKNLLVLGANVAQQCLHEDLVDELVLMILPILLGAGIPLFDSSGGRHQKFTTVSATQAGQATVLRLRS
jgi:dihydrofolate reductase